MSSKCGYSSRIVNVQVEEVAITGIFFSSTDFRMEFIFVRACFLAWLINPLEIKGNPAAFLFLQELNPDAESVHYLD